MKAQPSHDFSDDLRVLDEEMDADLEAWTTQDLDQFGSFGVSQMTDAAE